MTTDLTENTVSISQVTAEIGIEGVKQRPSITWMQLRGVSLEPHHLIIAQAKQRELIL